VLDAIKLRRKMTTHALLSVYAQVVEVKGRTLTLSFSTEPIRRQYHSGTNEEVLCEALNQVLGIECRIVTVAGGAAASGGAGGGDDDTGGSATGGRGPAPMSPAPYDGFAPGDEAADDEVDATGEPAPRVDPEEAAVALLAENLGAKVIGQIDAG
jgi:DNA polymerase III subunit gamma/tau